MKKIISQIISRAMLTTFASTSLLYLSTQSGQCTPQWVTWDVSAGGNGHQYLAVPGFAGLNWNAANTLAQAQGGYLASITSQAENDFVFGLINSSPFFNSFNGAGPAIGGYLNVPADGWHWTSGEAWSYTNWYPGDPNNGPAGYDNLIYWSNIPNTPARTWDDVEGNDSAPGGIGIGGYVVEVVPEPSSLAIIGFGSLLLVRRLASKRK